MQFSGQKHARGTSDAWDKKKPRYMQPEITHDYHTFARPSPPSPASSSMLVFQWIDIDYYTENPRRESSMLASEFFGGVEAPAASNEPLAVLRLYGITQEGQSVCCHIHGFLPYFYVKCPTDFCETALESFRCALSDASKACVAHVQLVHRRSIYGYQKDATPFVRVYMYNPQGVPKARDACESGAVGMLRNGSGEYTTGRLPTYESNFDFVLRFLVDTTMVGVSWVEIPDAGRYMVERHSITSHTQLELHVTQDVLVPHSPFEAGKPEWMRIAPFRILSFDIECAGRKGIFPEPEHDAVIQIASQITLQGDGGVPRYRVVFTLGTCLEIAGTSVVCFEKEEELLQAWRDFVVTVDPDIITGYNIINFDFPYLYKRAEQLHADAFPYLTRLRGTPMKMELKRFQSKQAGNRDSYEVTLAGRVIIDLILAIRASYKLRSYSLNSVSYLFLKEQKEDVAHSEITGLQNGDDTTRHRLAVYCLKDALLPLRLMEKLMLIVNQCEMVRVTGVPLSYLQSRGQQIKVVTQIYRKARLKELLLPYMRAEKVDTKYEGATVIEPKKGYYDRPIATLDFASLYPSIMISHNLCYSTLLMGMSDAERERLFTPDQVERSPVGAYFLRANTQAGVLPEILQELLSARSKAKEDLKKATDPFMKQVLEGRQLALKVSANSVYGFTGAMVGKLPCLDISRSVTGYGRQMIDLTKRLVEDKYSKKNGHPADSQVVYGDTDSVMVDFGLSSLARAIELGTEAAAFVTSHFVKPVKLTFEKVFLPFLLMKKKRYAGLLWTKTDKYDKLDAKGLENVRRDNCALVARVMDTCLQKMLLDRDVPGAVSFAKLTIASLLRNEVDLSLLVISKQLTRKPEEYAGRQAHVELAKKLRQRSPATAPNVGDRINYVMVMSEKGARACEKAEDPLYALNHNLLVDATYYLEQQLKKPLSRIFDPILKNVAELFHGEHTRTIVRPTPTHDSTAMMSFVVKRPTCVGCRVPCPDVLCASCHKEAPAILQGALAKLRSAEERWAVMEAQCNSCGQLRSKACTCTNQDCLLFYARHRAQKDIEEADRCVNVLSNALQ